MATKYHTKIYRDSQGCLIPIYDHPDMLFAGLVLWYAAYESSFTHSWIGLKPLGAP